MNSGNSKTSGHHRLLLILSDKVNLQRRDKYVVWSNLSIYYTWKEYKKFIQKKINLKYQLQHGMTTLNFQMDQILY